MAEEERDRFEIREHMRSMAKASFDQVRKTLSNSSLASKIQMIRSLREQRRSARAFRDASAMAFCYAEKKAQGLSMCAGTRACQRSERGDAAHRRHVQLQMRSLAEQAREMGRIMRRTAMRAAKQKMYYL
jgi:hypothetical protein